MSTLTIELPEALTAELDAVVKTGPFSSQAEAVRAAVKLFVRERKLALQEKHQLADIELVTGARREFFARRFAPLDAVPDRNLGDIVDENRGDS